MFQQLISSQCWLPTTLPFGCTLVTFRRVESQSTRLSHRAHVWQIAEVQTYDPIISLDAIGSIEHVRPRSPTAIIIAAWVLFGLACAQLLLELCGVSSAIDPPTPLETLREVCGREHQS